MKINLNDIVNIISDYERKILELRYALKDERTKSEDITQQLADKNNDYLALSVLVNTHKEAIEHYQAENSEYLQALKDIKQIIHTDEGYLYKMEKLHKPLDKIRGL